MKWENSFEVHKEKNKSKLAINFSLLGISLTIFTFIIVQKPKLLGDNIFLTLQLVCAIPLLVSSIFSRSKFIYNQEKKRYSTFAYITFLLAYSFIINSIGMLLFSVISPLTSYLFFGINVISALIYSGVEISYDRKAIKERIIKDLIFIVLIVVLGILPVLR